MQNQFLEHVLTTLNRQPDPSAWMSTSAFVSKWCEVRDSIPMNLRTLLEISPDLEIKVAKSQLFVRQRAPPLSSPPTSDTVVFVDTKQKCVHASHALNQVLTESQLLAVDLEGQLMKGGKIWLVQVATAASQVYIFDLLTQGVHREAIVALLTTLLESQEITKVMHDCRRDNEALRFLLNIELKNVVDTQVFHQHIQHQKLGIPRPKAKPSRISLNELLKTYGFPVNAMKDEMHRMFNEKNESDIFQMWTTRPLAPKFLEYAADDVRQLCACYQAMKIVSMQDADGNVLLLSAAHARTYTQPAVQGEPERICFDADGMPVYCPITPTMMTVTQDSTKAAMVIDNSGAEIGELLATLPKYLRDAIDAALERTSKALVEIVVDHGRCPSLLFDDGSTTILEETSSLTTIVNDCLKSLAQRMSFPPNSSTRKMFTDDNRMGLSGTLHRISGILDRKDEYVGLTFRIGRHIAGASELIRDLVARAARKNKGFLLVGCPGSGKTTLLRDLIGSLSGLDKRVIVVDTSNEISGDGDVPHKCIGRARRVQVKHRTKQHEVLIEAVQNHNPEVIVIDEIGTVKEVHAAKTISQRGVTLIGTAHGSNLGSILKNTDLNGLIGGLQCTTLGDMEMKKRGKGRKTITERVGMPIFGVAVEVLDKQRFRIYRNVAKTIDAMLCDQPYLVEERWREGSEMYSRRFYENSGSQGHQEHWYNALVAQVVQQKRFQDIVQPACSSSQ